MKSQFSSLKVLKHLERVGKVLKEEKIYPVSVDLSPSNLCNHNCVWCCYANYRSSNKDMLDKELMIRLVKELAQLGVKGINFTGGGEPLLNSATLEAMELAKRLGMDVGLITNGSLLDKNNIRRLVPICTYIRISLDAGSSETHDKLHGIKGHFDKVMENIKLLVEQKRKSNSECTIGTQLLIHKENINELETAIKNLREAGVDFVQVRPVVESIGGIAKVEEITEAPDLEQLSTPEFKVFVIREKFNRLKDKRKDYAQCFFHHFCAAVDADAQVYLCCHFIGKPKYSFGSLKQKSFKEIWDSEQRQRVIQSLSFADCEAACKGDGVNKLFDSIINTPHSNIL